MANEEINQRIRRRFGKAPAEEDVERKQGVTDVEDMPLPELLVELSVVTDRLAAVQAELAARAAAADAEKGEEAEEEGA